jgi:CRISPR-associated protein Csd2
MRKRRKIIKMEILSNKIDFVALISVSNANPNGDPLNGNRPRTDYDGFGEISDVCIKRKIRNRMQDLIGIPGSVFVQSEDRSDDGIKNLHDRAKTLGKITDKDEFTKEACEKWIDVRTFGQVFAFKGDSLSVGVRGPVSIHQAVSIDPVDIYSMQITKSVNGEAKDSMSSDRMGMKHFVKYGLYKLKGSINVQLAEKTGFTEDDAELIKECIRTMFVNDSSSARPDGSMEVVELFWFKHNCKTGQYSTAAVHRSVQVKIKDGVSYPKSFEDYDINLITLDGLETERISGN